MTARLAPDSERRICLKRIILAAALVLAATAATAAPALEASPPPSPSRWAVEGGYSLRFWDAATGESEQQREYQERARQGWNVGGDISVYPFVQGRLGLGVTYARFKRTLRDSAMIFPDGFPGSVRDAYTLHYAAPSLFFRQPLPASLELVAQAGAGWMYYHNHHESRDYPGVIEGVVLGLHGGLSLDYRPFRFVGVGAGARFIYGSLDRLDYNAMRTPFPAISLTRTDLFAGLRFYP